MSLHVASCRSELPTVCRAATGAQLQCTCLFWTKKEDKDENKSDLEGDEPVSGMVLEKSDIVYQEVILLLFQMVSDCGWILCLCTCLALFVSWAQPSFPL